MITGSCKERIKAKMPQLTETEKKIGKFVLENYETVLQCNVSELATHSGVSDASVVRFCRSIGYRGFQDFKMIQDESCPRHPSARQAAESDFGTRGYDRGSVQEDFSVRGKCPESNTSRVEYRGSPQARNENPSCKENRIVWNWRKPGSL